MEIIIKEIEGFPFYYVDNLGNVYSRKNRGGHTGFESQELRKLKLYTDSRKRLLVAFGGKKHFVSSLVLEAFVCKRPQGMLACHGVLGSLVNTVDNLYWGTPKQNQLDRFRDGTDCSGEKNIKAKLSNNDVHDIRKSYIPRIVTRVMLAQKYNVDRTTVDKILARKYWKHI